MRGKGLREVFPGYAQGYSLFLLITSHHHLRRNNPEGVADLPRSLNDFVRLPDRLNRRENDAPLATRHWRRDHQAAPAQAAEQARCAVA